MNKGRKEYARLFLLGEKTELMKNIEVEYPTLGKFSRFEAFFHAFGCFGWSFKWGWIMMLPARHDFNLLISESFILLNVSLFSVYYQRKQKS